MTRARIRRYIRHGMLPQLAVFEAVSRLGSYTRAAEELHLAQPTVSTQMKKLTDTLGVALLAHNGRRVETTEAGRELARACAEIFGCLARVEERLMGLRNLDQGCLHVAASSASRHFLPQLLSRFCERHPAVEVRLHMDNWRGMQNRLRHGEDELYVLSSLPQEPELTAYPIRPHSIGLYAAAGHPLGERRALAPEALRAEPFILREPGSATRRLADALCARWGFAPRVRMELAANEAIKQAIQDGLGIGLLPDELVGSDLAAEGLCALDVEGLPVLQHWFIAHGRTHVMSRVAAAFLDHVRAEAAAEAADPHRCISLPRRAA